MMISPEYYYEINLKGKTKEEILKEIRSLKREINRLKKVIAEGENSPENMIDPSPSTRISCSREYLEQAIRAYKEAGGEYIPTAEEEKKDKALTQLVISMTHQLFQNAMTEIEMNQFLELRMRILNGILKDTHKE